MSILQSLFLFEIKKNLSLYFECYTSVEWDVSRFNSPRSFQGALHKKNTGFMFLVFACECFVCLRSWLLVHAAQSAVFRVFCDYLSKNVLDM